MCTLRLCVWERSLGGEGKGREGWLAFPEFYKMRVWAWEFLKPPKSKNPLLLGWIDY